MGAPVWPCGHFIIILAKLYTCQYLAVFDFPHQGQGETKAERRVTGTRTRDGSQSKCSHGTSALYFCGRMAEAWWDVRET